MGNICRSPTAEGCMYTHVESINSSAQFLIESAGTTAYHSGQPPDSRSQQEALKNGITLSQQRARQVTIDDFNNFHQIVAMDRDNLSILEKMKPVDTVAELTLLTEWLPDSTFVDVPDPYYGGSDGFKVVFDLINESTDMMLQTLIKKEV